MIQLGTLSKSFRELGPAFKLSTARFHGASTEQFLKGKVALVTGSTSGIGLGVAEALACRGSDIVLSGFGDAKVIQDIKNNVENKYNVNCHHVSSDFTKEQEVLAMTDSILQLYPQGIDILVNNAGFQHISPVHEFPIDKWNDLLAVLITAPFLLIRAFLPQMVGKKWGRIVNVASAHSIRASPNKSAYCCAKHALAALTKVVALETAQTGVTCNAISPGYVETLILKGQVETLAKKEGLSYEEAKTKFLELFHPSRQTIGINQLAEFCVFLCTDASSQFIGSNLVMDGGWCAK